MDHLDHLTSLITDIPSWLVILDEQKDQIGHRQAELAHLSASSLDQSATLQGPSARSLRNKGSTESLRPKLEGRLEEEDEEAIVNDDSEGAHIGESPKQEDVQERTARSSSTPKVPPITTPRSPQLLQKKASNSKNVPSSSAIASPTKLPTTYPPQTQLLKRRKSRTSSLHSMHSSQSRHSQTPTHPAKLNRSNRTKSMIIVYYDSYVQESFENLVKHISIARNAMRKGKMAERMERMRKLAELDDSSEEEETEDETYSKLQDAVSVPAKNTNPESGTGNIEATKKPEQIGLNPFADKTGAIEADDNSDSGDDAFFEQAKLQFKSTRMMGPGRIATGGPGVPGLQLDASNSAQPQRDIKPGIQGARTGLAQTTSSPLLKAGPSLRRNAEEKSIYDDMDKTLELCQATCERAAHRFLRDGECYAEIADVRKRLEELVGQAKVEAARVEEEGKGKKSKKSAGQQVRLRGSGLAGGSFETNQSGIGYGEIRAREMRSPLMRKSPTPARTFSAPNALGSNTESPSKVTAVKAPDINSGLEVDDEEDEGLGMDIDPDPPKLIFRSSRAGGIVRR